MCFSPFNGWSLWIHFAVTCCWFSSKNLLTAMTQHLFITLRAAETVSCLPWGWNQLVHQELKWFGQKFGLFFVDLGIVWNLLFTLHSKKKTKKHRGVNSPAVGDDQILFVSMLIPIDYKNYNVPNGKKHIHTHTFLAFQKVHYLLTLNILRPT